MSGEVESFVREKLGHSPTDLTSYERALTHSSVRRDSYERLEFLGDRVLGLVIARELYERYPAEPEGNLSRRYNALVARETCAEVGRELGIPKLIRLGKQARDDGANQSDNVVGDAVEALIGALFLDAPWSCDCGGPISNVRMGRLSTRSRRSRNWRQRATAGRRIMRSSPDQAPIIHQPSSSG